jgi:hypothetical protein
VLRAARIGVRGGAAAEPPGVIGLPLAEADDTAQLEGVVGCAEALVCVEVAAAAGLAAPLS